ncbi:MAG: HlyD family efflux transporter periplasmic adaptor subunit [Clostridia bacterium]
MARSRVKIKGRFFLILFGAVGLLALIVVLILGGRGRGEIQFGSISVEMDVTAAIVRDEKVIMTEPYEKIAFNVVEGQTVANGDLIAQVYKRGYQDETMISLINLQKQIYAYQLQLLGGQQPQELIDINERIHTVEGQIRATSRNETSLDMLTLEQTLKGLQIERINLLQVLLTADPSLNNMYAELNAQLATQESWKRDIKNESGSGLVSFYFDGYEKVLCCEKLNTINAALVNSVVKGGNTANTADSTSESPLYRIIANTHWYLAFATKAAEPLRLAEGESYTVQFIDYSEQEYSAVARETTVSENSVVNLLEFNTDIGKLAGVRTVAIKIKKAAQGLVVPLNAIVIDKGIPGININYGDAPLRVEIDILAKDDKKAVIRAKNEADTLAAGQKFIKP